MGVGSFIKSLFKQDADSKPTEPLGQQDENFENCTAGELADFLKTISKTGGLTTQMLFKITSRLFDIAFFDHGIDETEIDKAERLLDYVIGFTEQVLSEHPDQLDNYNIANEFNIERVKKMGRGSLAWKIEDNDARGSMIFDVIVDKSSGPLIATYKMLFDKKDWDASMHSIMKALIVDRLRNCESNATLILSGLIFKADLVAWNILEPEDRIALTSVSTNYMGARRVLERYGVLPEMHNFLPFEPRLIAEELAKFLVHAVIEYKSSPVYEDIEPIIHELPYGHDIIRIPIIALRLKLTINMLSDIYDHDYSQSVKDYMIGMINDLWDSVVHKIFDVIENVEKNCASGKCNIGDEDKIISIDCAVSAALLDYLIEDESSIDDASKLFLMQRLTDIVNICRVNWMHDLRFLLRFTVNKIDENKSKYSLNEEEYIMMKIAGSSALAKKTIFEDVIAGCTIAGSTS